jgi:hypothetical protein
MSLDLLILLRDGLPTKTTSSSGASLGALPEQQSDCLTDSLSTEARDRRRRIELELAGAMRTVVGAPEPGR